MSMVPSTSLVKLKDPVRKSSPGTKIPYIDANEQIVRIEDLMGKKLRNIVKIDLGLCSQNDRALRFFLFFCFKLFSHTRSTKYHIC